MIEVDLTKFVPAELNGYPELVRAAIPEIVEGMRTEMIRLAHERLHTSAEDFIAGIQPPRYHIQSGDLPGSDTPIASIDLVGWLPNKMEEGWEGGDMKPWLLAGRNARMTKQGPVNVVPFRHGAPGATGNNFPPMGSQFNDRMGTEEAARLGKRVYAKAKRLAATTSDPSTGRTQWGGRLPAGNAPVLRPHHRTDIYAGMVRQRKTYEKATQSQYKTFRAVSKNSDPRAWIHPGIEGQHIMRDAAGALDRIAGRLLGAVAKGIKS